MTSTERCSLLEHPQHTGDRTRSDVEGLEVDCESQVCPPVHPVNTAWPYPASPTATQCCMHATCPQLAEAEQCGQGSPEQSLYTELTAHRSGASGGGPPVAAKQRQPDSSRLISVVARSDEGDQHAVINTKIYAAGICCPSEVRLRAGGVAAEEAALCLHVPACLMVAELTDFSLGLDLCRYQSFTMFCSACRE